MAYSTWQSGLSVVSPVYLDSGVLIAALVRKDPRYQQASFLVADLLINQVEIVISILTLSETLWGLAKLSHQQLFNQPPRTQFNPEIYRRHSEQIFQTHGSRMYMVHDTIRDWLDAGIVVSIIPANIAEMQHASQVSPDYMRKFQLASADAVHLALAQSHAKSFVTTDSEFQRAAALSVHVIHIAP